GLELFGDGADIAADHPHGDVRPIVEALRRKGERAGGFSGHAAILPGGQTVSPVCGERTTLERDSWSRLGFIHHAHAKPWTWHLAPVDIRGHIRVRPKSLHR